MPTPPTFLHEFAGSLLEFALMEQAMELDQVLLVHTAFAASRQELNLNWTLLFIPDRASLQALAAGADRARISLNIEVSTVSAPGPSGTSASPALVSVAIGQWAVAAAPAKIRTLLGSCVGRGALRPGRPAGRPGPHRPARLAGGGRPPRQVRRHGDPRHDRRDRAAAPGEGPRPAGRQARGGGQHVRDRRGRRIRR